MKKTLTVAALLCSIWVYWSFTSERAGAEQSVKLVTEDKKTLEATYFPSQAPNAPAVILVPDTRCDKSVFGSFPTALNKAGFAVLSTDMRYKELIARTRTQTDAIRALQAQDLFAPVTYDMKSALDFLTSQAGVDPNNITFLGISYGSRVALHAGVKYKAKALVLVSLSGNEALPGKSVQALLEEYGEHPILFMTSDKDWGNNNKAAEDNRRYVTLTKGKKDLKIWEGSAHGADILAIKGAPDLVASWLRQNL
jgi:dienelactone hydrolase